MEGKKGESGVVLVREQSIHAENFGLNERTFASPRFYQYFVIPSRLEVFKSTPLHMSLFGHIQRSSRRGQGSEDGPKVQAYKMPCMYQNSLHALRHRHAMNVSSDPFARDQQLPLVLLSVEVDGILFC